jgi:hypothetical protein
MPGRIRSLESLTAEVTAIDARTDIHLLEKAYLIEEECRLWAITNQHENIPLFVDQLARGAILRHNAK